VDNAGERTKLCLGHQGGGTVEMKMSIKNLEARGEGGHPCQKQEDTNGGPSWLLLGRGDSNKKGRQMSKENKEGPVT